MLLIPEINFEAPTPTKTSPCISPKQDFVHQKRDFVLKYSDGDADDEEEKLADKEATFDYKITDEDWDRMEAIAEEERLRFEEEIGPGPEEIEENRRKLQEFRDNPKIDISTSRLAHELKMILEEAKMRVENDKNIEQRIKRKKKKKNQQKEVTFDTLANTTYDPVSVQDVLRQVESEMKDDGGQDNDVEFDDQCLLNGFMDGFEDESNEDAGNILSQLSTNRGMILKTSVACMVVMGAAILIKKLHN